MQILDLITEYDTILDVLALASSFILILFLMRNRRKYGHILLNARHVKGCEGFAGEVSRQMITQQSQKAYDNLQRSLQREFESLRRVGAGALSATVSDQTSATHIDLNRAASERVLESRNSRYRRADKMIAKGAGVNQILQRCGLAEGELELLQGLRQFAQGTRS